jgi:hypothetical protein
MTALGHKQTSCDAKAMFAVPPRADIPELAANRLWEVPFALTRFDSSKIVRFAMESKTNTNETSAKRSGWPKTLSRITTVPRGCGSRSNGYGCLGHFAGTKLRKKINQVNPRDDDPKVSH